MCVSGIRFFSRPNHYDTFFAADSSSAVSEARKQQPDLIVLDLGLPAGDGFIWANPTSSTSRPGSSTRAALDRQTFDYLPPTMVAGSN